MDSINKFHQHIDKMLKDIKFGEGQIEFQVHDGRPVYIFTNNLEHRTYQQDGAAEAFARLVERVKVAREQKRTGTITGAIKMHKGEVKEIMIQDVIKKSMDDLDIV